MSAVSDTLRQLAVTRILNLDKLLSETSSIAVAGNCFLRHMLAVWLLYIPEFCFGFDQFDSISRRFNLHTSPLMGYGK